MNCSKQNLNHLTHQLALRTLFSSSIFSNTCFKLESGLTFNLNGNNLHYDCSSKYQERSLEMCCPWEQHSPFSVMYNKEREEAKKMQNSAFILSPT